MTSFDDKIKTKNLGAGESMTLTLNAREIRTMQIIVDDGGGGAPSTYNLQAETQNEDGTWMIIFQSGDTTARHEEITSVPVKVRVTLTNPADLTASDFRMRVVAP